MANALAARQMYIRLGLTQEVADVIRVEQGIDSIDTLHTLNSDDIKALCDSVRKPGGLNATADGPNPGHQISAIFQKRLKQAVYLVHHQ